MSNKTLQSYFIGANEVLLQHNLHFSRLHKDFQEVNALLLAEVKINGETLFGSLDNGDKKFALDLCKRFIEAYQEDEE